MHEQTIASYVATFNERDARKRRAAINELYTEDCEYTDPHVSLRGRDAIDVANVYSADGTYTDPLASVRGIEAISAFIAAIQQQFKGVVFVLGDTFDAHHDQARFTWNAMAPGLLEPVAVGFDVAVFERGRIRDVHGFLDRALANA